eukprot:1485841-Prymnesium_polylepis.1
MNRRIGSSDRIGPCWNRLDSNRTGRVGNTTRAAHRIVAASAPIVRERAAQVVFGRAHGVIVRREQLQCKVRQVHPALAALRRGTAHRLVRSLRRARPRTRSRLLAPIEANSGCLQLRGLQRAEVLVGRGGPAAELLVANELQPASTAQQPAFGVGRKHPFDLRLLDAELEQGGARLQQ